MKNNLNENELFKEFFDEEMRTFNDNDLENGCKLYYKIYSSCVNAGFTPDQAMDILKTILIGVIRGQNR